MFDLQLSSERNFHYSEMQLFGNWKSHGIGNGEEAHHRVGENMGFRSSHGFSLQFSDKVKL